MAAVDEFDVVMEQQGTRLWLHLAGDLDVGATPDFRDAISLAERSDATEVVVDLSGLAFLDSTGLGILLQACAGPDGTRFRLVRGKSHIQRVIELSGLEPELPFLPSTAGSAG